MRCGKYNKCNKSNKNNWISWNGIIANTITTMVLIIVEVIITNGIEIIVISDTWQQQQ